MALELKTMEELVEMYLTPHLLATLTRSTNPTNSPNLVENEDTDMPHYVIGRNQSLFYTTPITHTMARYELTPKGQTLLDKVLEKNASRLNSQNAYDGFLAICTDPQKLTVVQHTLQTVQSNFIYLHTLNTTPLKQSLDYVQSLKLVHVNQMGYFELTKEGEVILKMLLNPALAYKAYLQNLKD